MCFEPDIPETPQPTRVRPPEADAEDVTSRLERDLARRNTRDSLVRDPAVSVPSDTGIRIN